MFSRRNFLRTAGSMVGACLNLPFIERSLSNGAPTSFRVVFVEPKDGERTGQSGARLGVTMGMEEVSRVGELLGRSVEWGVVSETAALRGSLRESPPTAIIGGFSRDSCLGLAHIARDRDCLFVNVGCKDDGLRGPECHPAMIHVEASRRMYSDAIKMYKGSEPERPSAGKVVSVLWHPDLFRYGAAQLNERFVDRFGIGMDGAAWAGWMGCKIVWEAAMRASSQTTSEITDYLLSPSARFDGHKGWPLSFRRNGQLRQPLYLADASGSVISEVPIQGQPGDQSSQEILDEIGSAPSRDGSALGCRIRN